MPTRYPLWKIAISLLVLCFLGALAGCAAPSGSGPAVAVNGSGNLVLMGDLSNIKALGGSALARCSSGLDTSRQAEASAGGDLGVNAATQTGSLGASTANTFAGALAALDTCGPADSAKALGLTEGQVQHLRAWLEERAAEEAAIAAAAEDAG